MSTSCATGLAEQRLVAQLVEAVLGLPLAGGTGSAPDGAPGCDVGGRTLRKMPALEVDRREQVAVAEQHLGLAEEQHAAVGEREVEPGEDPGLGLGVEVHQRVAADQQVDPGDRGVLDQVVAAEDHRAAQVLAEDVAAGRPARSTAPELRRDAARPRGRRSGLPGLGERLLVDVGGVDLHPVPELVGPEHLGQQHRQRVRLLAGGAAGAPHPDRLRRALAGEQRRETSRAQELPGLGVAEEAGDVDQDRVEQRGELVGVDLEVVEVLGVVGDRRPGSSGDRPGASGWSACTR